ncbi:leucine-rich repeat domain-containing protein [Treponema sp. R80B11-R83G3]
MKKNVILVVALFALMVSALSAQTYNAESDFQVTKNGNAITIEKYVGTKAVVSIPPSIQNTPVTIIGGNAFKNNKTITSVTIPDSVKTIKEGAFYACNSITSLTIGKGITSLEYGAFNACAALTSVTFQGEINLGYFDSLAFDTGTGNLRSTFYAERYAIGWPGTYTRPDARSTTWTRQGATTTTTPASSGDPESDFKVTKTANAVTITQYVGNKTAVNIPSRIQNLPVTIIDDCAFQDQNKITSIIIPNGVTSIGEYAFMNCASLTNITIPNSVKSIGKNAFNLCVKLTSVTLPNSITTIGKDAFRYCSALISVTFSGTIPSAGFDDAFRGQGDIRAKFYATDKDKGTAGTYTTTSPAGTASVWTKK